MRGYSFCFSAVVTLLLPVAFLFQTQDGLAQSVSPSAFSKPTVTGRAPILTAQQLQIAKSMTPTQIAAYQAKIQPTLANLTAQVAAHQTPVSFSNWQSLIRGLTADGSPTNSSISSSTLSFSIGGGAISTIPTATAAVIAKTSAPAAVRLPAPPGGACPAWGCGPAPKNPFPPALLNPDLDQDGLPDAFEAQVADYFTPLYGTSAGDQQQFAMLADALPISFTSLVGTTPPYSYYRVQPLGPTTDVHNNPLFALRVDYLTLWNGDGGLVGGGALCAYSDVGLDKLIQQLSGHFFDAERSAVLLAAPAVNGGYNSDATTYKMYTLYTGAHEGTFFDQSEYYNFSTPYPVDNHVHLALSLSKHSTYAINPDFLPITPAWFIDLYFNLFLTLYESGIFNYQEYLYSTLVATDVFYGCVVERFSDQGVTEANPRTNVGEPLHPINGSTFIQDNSSRALNLTDKLTTPLF